MKNVSYDSDCVVTKTKCGHLTTIDILKPLFFLLLKTIPGAHGWLSQLSV